MSDINQTNQTNHQRKIQVAAAQMVSTPDPAENCETAARLVREAAAAGAQVVLLPE